MDGIEAKPILDVRIRLDLEGGAWRRQLQATASDGRAHRLGRTYPVTVYRYICSNTIEERIDAKLREKRKMFQEVVEDVSLDLTTAMTEGELFGLFGLAVPRATRR